MPRLPIPDSDDGVWGSILNGFLEVAHNTDGTLQTSAIRHAGGVTSINGVNATNGSVTLTASDVSAPTTLAGDSDVSITAPSNSQVLTYNSTSSKWTNQSAPSSKGRVATVTIAASNSSTNSKNSADYVCAGSGDEATINSAIGTLPNGGGRVVLLEGNYNCTGPIVIDSNYITLEGQGFGFATSITAPNGGVSRNAAIIVGNTKIVYECNIRNLALNVSGGTQAVQSGTGHGIVVAGDTCAIENVIVQFCSGDAFHLGQDLLNPTLRTTIASGSNGQAFPQTTNNVASTTGFAASGAIIIATSAGPAYVEYTGTTATSFTGCSCSYPSGASLATGHAVTQGMQVYDILLTNCLADNPGGHGFYYDWNYSSCELIACHADGNNGGKPGTTGTSNGFTIYGTQIKLVVCHAYYFNQYGLMIGDSFVYTAGAITVIGGEWETNSKAGVYIVSNTGPVFLNGLQFYGNGVGGTSSDLFLGYGATEINVLGCTFRKSSQSNVLKQIYMFQSTYVYISNCEFEYAGVAQNVFIDGSSGPCSYIFVRNNRMQATNAGASAVLLKGAVTLSEVSGNTVDATIKEIVLGSSPDYNIIRNNSLVSGYSATITTVGPHTQAYKNLGFTGTQSPLLSLGGAGSDVLGGAITTFNGSGSVSNTLDDGSGNATFAGMATASAFAASGLTGATANSRYVGATSSGAPTTGTFAVGDYIIDQTGKIWICTVAGSPGSWTLGSGGSASLGTNTFTGNQTAPAFAASGLTGATAPSRYVGATTGGPPSSGTFTVGDFVVDQTGTIWACTTAGTIGSGAVFTQHYSQSLKDNYLKPSAALYETVSRAGLSAASISLSTGVLYMSSIALPANTSIGHITFASYPGGGATSPTHWWFGLFDNNRNALAFTADQTTAAWGGNTAQTLAIATTASGSAASFTTTYSGQYYLAVMMAASTPVEIVCANSTAGIVNLSPVLNGTANGAQTAPPSFPFQAIALSSVVNYAYAYVGS